MSAQPAVLAQAIPFAEFAQLIEWNGRPFLYVGAATGKTDRDVRLFANRCEDALQGFGFGAWSTRTRQDFDAPGVFRTVVELCGPGEWTDVSLLPRSD